MVNDIRDQAIADCKYGLSLGSTCLNAHISIWTEIDVELDDEELQYREAIIEISEKLGGEECLLK